jgi:PEP-CTERM motif
MNKAKNLFTVSKLLGSALIAVSAISASFASAEVLNFDDIQTPAAVPSGYHGFGFSNRWVVHTDAVNAHSGSNYVDYTTAGDYTLSISSGAGLSFDGLWARTPNASQHFEIVAYFDNSFLGRQQYIATNDYQFFSFEVPGGTRPTNVNIYVNGGSLFIDDVCVNGGCNTTVSAVPEPSSYALMLAGVGLLGFVRSRRRRH